MLQSGSKLPNGSKEEEKKYRKGRLYVTAVCVRACVRVRRLEIEESLQAF
jgi:hypothetical protein